MLKKHSILKKLFGLMVIGAVVYGIIAFFKKFEQENDDEDFNSFQVPTGYEYGENDHESDAERNYTTIAGEEATVSEKESDTTKKTPPTEATETTIK